MPPLLTDLPCPVCQSQLNLRSGAKGPWLSCSRFPKCRGRGKWAELDEKVKKGLETQLKQHEMTHPVPIIRTMSGKPLTDTNGKPLPNAPVVGTKPEGESAAETLESVADEIGV